MLTSPLLEEHGDCRNDDSPEHRHGLEERSNGDELKLYGARPALVSQVRELLLDCALFEERLRLDLEEFQFHQLMVLRHGSQHR